MTLFDNPKAVIYEVSHLSKGKASKVSVIALFMVFRFTFYLGLCNGKTSYYSFFSFFLFFGKQLKVST